VIDLINQAINKARAILSERQPELSKEELEQSAKVLGVSAIKYADLSNYRLGDYIFSYDKMLQFEGNTAAFILYSYVRALSIERRLDAEQAIGGTKVSFDLEHPSELGLALLILQFDEALEGVLKDLVPHRLADYLYQLAQAFNVFFRDCRVIGDPKQESRRLLTRKAAEVFRTGCDLLGLSCIERM
jgi:arginyl-tRNA synthetase